MSIGKRAGRDVLVKKYGSRAKRYLPPKKSKWKVKENIVSKKRVINQNQMAICTKRS